MSKRSVFKEALEGRVAGREPSHVSSASRTIRMLLLPPDSIDRPVAFMRLLWDHGVSLKKARDIVEQLAKERPAVVELNTDAPELVSSELAKWGIAHGVLEVPDVDVKQIREKQRLSQRDFARWYGLEVDTVRNWEQHRSPLEGAAKVLLNVIEKEPCAVLRVLVTQRFTHEWSVNIHEHILLTERLGKPPAAPPGYVWVLQRKSEHVGEA
jgi:DNA-binding transcriptional regulator YiaG